MSIGSHLRPSLEVVTVDDHLEGEHGRLLAYADDCAFFCLDVLGGALQQLEAAEVDRRFDLGRASSDPGRLDTGRDDRFGRRRPQRFDETPVQQK